jgi:hypothetical protein
MNWSILSLEVNAGKTPCPHAATELMIHSRLIKWGHIRNKRATLIHYFRLLNQTHSEQMSQLNPTLPYRKIEPYAEQAHNCCASLSFLKSLIQNKEAT